MRRREFVAALGATTTAGRRARTANHFEFGFLSPLRNIQQLPMLISNVRISNMYVQSIRKLSNLVPPLLILTTLMGCGLIAANRNNEALLSLQVDMTREEVISLMGQPAKREAYGSTEYLIYKTNTTGQSERADFTPIAITNGKVAGWGRNYYDSSLKSKIEADINVKQR
jgi:hypothetical protein